jgi:adenylate cyclase
MRPSKVFFTIMFADISSSAELYRLLGDTEARIKIAEYLDLLTAIATQYQGSVIKTIGDEILCTYPKPDAAMTAAGAMHHAFEAKNVILNEGLTLDSALRIGMHYGPVIHDGSDIFGRAVNTAARMVAMAKSRQTLTTRRTVTQLTPLKRSLTCLVDRVAIKGLREPVDVFEVIWKEDEITHSPSDLPADLLASTGPEVSLLLRHQNCELELNGRLPFVIIGRSTTCDLILEDKMVSRQHLRIEFRRGKFYLIDYSTNGTFIRTSAGEELFIRREESPLWSSGELRLGRSFGESTDHMVHFETKEQLSLFN